MRVVEDWNSLPDEVVSAGTVNSFKGLDRHWRKRMYCEEWTDDEGYSQTAGVI